MNDARIDQECAFSVLEHEPQLRLARWLGFAPPGGFGAGRRAIILGLLAWVPIMVWALYTGNLTWGSTGESLLQHYSVHVRCLVFIPMLILAEPLFYRMTRLYGGYLALATTPDRPERFVVIVARMRRLRNATWPWVVMIVLTILISLTPGTEAGGDALRWALLPDGEFGFGGFWFLVVVRPLSTLLLLAWVWRLVLLTIWLFHVARLDPELVPTHPDRCGGIGFLEDLPVAFSLVTLAVSTQIAARLAHEILQHGATLASYGLLLLGFAVTWTLLLLAPLLVFVPTMVWQRRRAMLQYSNLVGRQGRLVHRRWIAGEDVGEQPLLDAPEIGPLADAEAMYEVVRRMRLMPFGWRSLVGTLLPMAFTALLLYALHAPIRELGLYLLKILA